MGALDTFIYSESKNTLKIPIDKVECYRASALSRKKSGKFKKGTKILFQDQINDFKVIKISQRNPYALQITT